MDKVPYATEMLLFPSHGILFKGKQEKPSPPLLGFHTSSLKDFRKKFQAFPL